MTPAGQRNTGGEGGNTRPLPPDLARLLHDVRGPLNSLTMHLQVLKRTVAEDELAADSLRTVQEQIARLADMLPAAFALAALLADGTGDLENTFSRFQALRRTRTRKIQRSSWVTSSLLHLPDGPAAEARNAKLGRVPENFGWIHEYDVQQELQKIGCTPARVPVGTT